MGTRGHPGGLAEATLQAVLVLDAAGKDVVFVETVGTGQNEIGVLSIADTVVLALMPGSGDCGAGAEGRDHGDPGRDRDQQARPSARRAPTRTDVRQMLALGAGEAPPIVLTEALRGEGVDGALGGDRRRTRPALEADGRLEERRAAQPRGRGVRGRLGTRAPASGECSRRTTRSCCGCSTRCAAGSSTR